MCGRFASYKNLNKLINIFNITNSDFNMSKSYNISPGQNVNIILSYKFENYFLASNWGYNFINNKTQHKQIVINSRIETINSKLLFKDSFLKRKCIIPANGYFEWLIQDKVKIPYYHTFKDQMMYFGGIFNEQGACIVTRQSYPLKVEVHHRQPIILRYNDFESWFASEHDYACEHSQDMDIFKVTSKVNSPKNNAPDNIERI